jgi:hypothetical protein
VNSISVETFINNASDAHEILHRVLGNDNMYGGKGFLLIQTPYVKLMDGADTRDLRRAISVCVKKRDRPNDGCLPFLDRGSHLPYQHL